MARARSCGRWAPTTRVSGSSRIMGCTGSGARSAPGLSAFTGDAVVIMMADCSDSPEDLVRYYYILRDEADCAFGSRFTLGSQVIDYPKHKLLVNRLANKFVSMLFRVQFNDMTNAFKGYRSYVIDGCKPLMSPHFNLTVEIPLKAITRGYTYKVVPISWRNRSRGVSNLKIKEMGSRYLYIVLNVWLEKMLTQGDYRRPRGEEFVPWPMPDVAAASRKEDRPAPYTAINLDEVRKSHVLFLRSRVIVMRDFARHKVPTFQRSPSWITHTPLPCLWLSITRCSRDDGYEEQCAKHCRAYTRGVAMIRAQNRGSRVFPFTIKFGTLRASFSDDARLSGNGQGVVSFHPSGGAAWAGLLVTVHVCRDMPWLRQYCLRCCHPTKHGHSGGSGTNRTLCEPRPDKELLPKHQPSGRFGCDCRWRYHHHCSGYLPGGEYLY